MREFDGFGAFAKYLSKLAIIGVEVVHHAADQCGNLVEESAKAEIGFYQPAVGPFVKWEDLADSTEADKARHGYPMDAPLLRTGTLRDSISHQTDGHDVVVGSTSKLMVYHEFGTEKIPPRPVLGPALYMHKVTIIAGVGGILESWLAGVSWKRKKLKL